MGRGVCEAPPPGRCHCPLLELCPGLLSWAAAQEAVWMESWLCEAPSLSGLLCTVPVPWSDLEDQNRDRKGLACCGRSAPVSSSPSKMCFWFVPLKALAKGVPGSSKQVAEACLWAPCRHLDCPCHRGEGLTGSTGTWFSCCFPDRVGLAALSKHTFSWAPNQQQVPFGEASRMFLAALWLRATAFSKPEWLLNGTKMGVH